MSGTRLPSSRQSLAVYPLFLFYFICESTSEEGRVEAGGGLGV